MAHSSKAISTPKPGFCGRKWYFCRDEEQVCRGRESALLLCLLANRYLFLNRSVWIWGYVQLAFSMLGQFLSSRSAFVRSCCQNTRLVTSRSLECPLNGEILDFVSWFFDLFAEKFQQCQSQSLRNYIATWSLQSDFSSIILLPALPSDSKNGLLLSPKFLLFSVWVSKKLWADPSIHFLNKEYIPFPIKVFFMCTQIHLVSRSCLFCLTQAKQEPSRCFRVCSNWFSNICIFIFSTAIARRCGEQNESP